MLKGMLNWRILIGGLLGAFLGRALESLLAQVGGPILISDGMVWGAVIGLFVISLPNFERMGTLILGHQQRGINVLVGIFAFIAISIVILVIFMVIIWAVGVAFGPLVR
ncbi:MAG: hypothetical protein H5T64_00885 [Chloroflexi bacterium]|nr:hypothetical protein [Chloroflexota bacterium]